MAYPIEHVAQTELEVAPVVVEYVPVGHWVQTVDAALDEYVPAGQLTQFALDVAPIMLEYVPAAQLLHVVPLLK